MRTMPAGCAWHALPMLAPTFGRTPIVRSLAVSLCLLGAAVALLVAAEVTVPLTFGDGPLWAVLMGPVSTVIFVAAGLGAWWRRPNNHLGSIMVGGGVVMGISNLGSLHAAMLTLASIVLATLPLAVLVHLLLAFPSGRPASRVARRVVFGGYAVCLVLQVPLYVFDSAASPGGILAIGDHHTITTVAAWVQVACGLAIMVATAALLWQRFGQASPPNRRVLGPLYLYGIAAVLAVPLIGAVLGPSTGMAPLAASLAQVAIITAVPVAVWYAMAAGGFSRAGDVQELGAWISLNDTDRGTLRDALARCLGDPSVRLAYWAATLENFVDERGRPVSVPTPGTREAAVDIDIGGRKIAAVCYDPVLISDESLVIAAGRIVAMALDREHFAAELRASHAELQGSRSRIVQAGDRERQRIARDLHDGLQAELVLIGVQAQRLAERRDVTPDMAQLAAGLRRQIDRASANLRHVVHAVMPPPLVERGLVFAVEDLVDRMPIATALAVPDADTIASLASHIQNSAYFVIAEALTNAVKYSQATEIRVQVAVDEGRLRLDVADNGIGGATVSGGLGLRGITDRVNALGGRAELASPAGDGTRLRVELPCE